MGFLLEWKRYLDEIESQYPRDRPFRGKKMDATVFEKVRGLEVVRACPWFYLHALPLYSKLECKLIYRICR